MLRFRGTVVDLHGGFRGAIMPTLAHISNTEARRVLLAVHGLSCAPQKKLTSSGLLALIESMGFVQVDSISAIARAHHMILLARNHTYQQPQLAPLLEQERVLFENWTHDAAIIPMQFYPYWQPRFVREQERLRTAWQQRRSQGYEAQVDQVLQHIRVHGPVMARDLGTEQKKGARGWWDWHPSKTALEYLWRCGVLAITRRDGFQKVYDLTERVIPETVRSSTPTRDAMVDWACRSALERLGVATSREIAGFWAAVGAAEVQAWCKRHVDDGIVQVMVDCADGSSRPMWARGDLIEWCKDLPPPPGHLRFLSPFDPLIRDRLRTLRLFHFDYRIEVFVPAAQRRYGYYVLPMLQGDAIIGRIDIKHQRQESQLLVTGLWLEPHQRFTKVLQRHLGSAVERLRQFVGADTVVFANGYVKS
jgi:uncharacterized protein YcaQ